MIAPTTEDAYQQTEVVYRPTSESIQSKFKKIKNPLKVPQALLSPDRSVSIRDDYDDLLLSVKLLFF